MFFKEWFFFFHNGVFVEELMKQIMGIIGDHPWLRSLTEEGIVKGRPEWSEGLREEGVIS